VALNISTSEAKAKLSNFLQQVVNNREEVIIQKHGDPQAVLIPYSEYEQFNVWREQARRRQALAELQKLADEIHSRNQDLSPAKADELADRFTREVIEDMIAEGKIKYRDERG